MNDAASIIFMAFTTEVHTIIRSISVASTFSKEFYPLTAVSMQFSIKNILNVNLTQTKFIDSHTYKRIQYSNMEVFHSCKNEPLNHLLCLMSDDVASFSDEKTLLFLSNSFSHSRIHSTIIQYIYTKTLNTWVDRNASIKFSQFLQ